MLPSLTYEVSDVLGFIWLERFDPLLGFLSKLEDGRLVEEAHLLSEQSKRLLLSRQQLVQLPYLLVLVVFKHRINAGTMLQETQVLLLDDYYVNNCVDHR